MRVDGVQAGKSSYDAGGFYERQHSYPQKRLAGCVAQEGNELALILVIMCVALSFATTSFFTSDNLFNILKQTTLVCIIAIGQTFVIISGGIDLSVGQSMTLGSLILAYSLKAGIPLAISILLGILASMLVGACNGLLITKLRLPAFIITLGMTNIVKGAILVMSEGNIVLLDDPVIAAIGRDSLGPVPWMVIMIGSAGGNMYFCPYENRIWESRKVSGRQ